MTTLPQPVIAGYVRSPFTPATKGELAMVRPDDIASQVIKELVKRTGVKKEAIEDLIVGCAFPEGEQGLNIGRQLVFLSDLPLSVAGVTVNRFCGSSMQSIHMACGQILAGAGDAFIAVGIESMSRIPMSGFNPLPHPQLFAKYPEAYTSMGVTAENLAKKYKIKRKDQELFAAPITPDPITATFFIEKFFSLIIQPPTPLQYLAHHQYTWLPAQIVFLLFLIIAPLYP